MRESDFTRELVGSINQKYGYAFHPVASPYMAAGWPDVVASIQGKFWGFENKMVKELPVRMTTPILKHEFTDLQINRIEKIRMDGEGQGVGLINIRPMRIVLVISDLKFANTMTMHDVDSWSENLKLKSQGGGIWILDNLVKGV